jgi:hypothetical protein
MAWSNAVTRRGEAIISLKMRSHSSGGSLRSVFASADREVAGDMMAGGQEVRRSRELPGFDLSSHCDCHRREILLYLSAPFPSLRDAIGWATGWVSLQGMKMKSHASARMRRSAVCEVRRDMVLGQEGSSGELIKTSLFSSSVRLSTSDYLFIVLLPSLARR